MNVWGAVAINCAVIAGFIALAWHFDRWWIGTVRDPVTVRMERRE